MQTGFFTTTEACDLLGMSRRQFLYLVEKRLIIPLIENVGKGNSYIYSWNQILEAKAISRMKQAKVSLKTIQQSAIELSKYLETKPSLADKRIVVSNKKLYFFNSDLETQEFVITCLSGLEAGQIVIYQILKIDELEKQCIESAKVLHLSERFSKCA